MKVQVVLVALLCSCVEGRAPTVPRRPHKDVKTRMGVARGYMYKDADYYAFLGLPYARAPIKNRRFKAPDPPPRWDGIFEATHRVKCPQPDGEGEENCLVVNVFMPESTLECCGMPVLVFVHDGRFQSGWGAYQPPERFIKDFIVVTFNYRLGLLGFLCIGIEELPGNVGLKDQVAALYWIKSNIHSFGGNPDDINVYGIGSGAASVQLLLLSGLVGDLFHRVILESGSALSPTSMAYNPFDTALTYAVSIGYEDDGKMEDLVKFYKEQRVTNLLNTSLMFLPCVEQFSHHSLIEKDPILILKDNNFDKVPMLIVYTNAEQIAVLEENPEKFEEVPENFDMLLPNNLNIDKIQMRAKIADLIKEFYFREVFMEPILKDYADYVNDIFMEYPVMKFATLYADSNSFHVYVMKFTYNIDGESKFGARYGDVLNYILSSESSELDNQAEVVAQKIMTLFRSFMKINDPTPLTTSLIPVIWPPVSSRQTTNRIDVARATYLIFGRTFKINNPKDSESMIFLDNIYDRFYKLHEFDGGT